MNEKQYNAAVSRVRSLATDIYRDSKSACHQLSLWAVEEYGKGEYRQAKQFAESAQKHYRTMRSVAEDVNIDHRVPATWEDEIAETIAARAEIACRYMVLGDAEKARRWVDSTNKWKAMRSKLLDWSPTDTTTLAACVTEGGGK